MTLTAFRCDDGHLTLPGHPVCPTCRQPQADTVDLTDATARVVTWTNSRSTPPGVRTPNPIAIVEFDLDGSTVRTIGQLTTAEVSIGDEVRPVHAEELRDPGAGIREPDSQSWDGYRFEPT